MISKSLRLVFVAMLMCGLAACDAVYQIQAPEAESVHTSPPTEFIVSYDTQPQKLPKITLNGYPVQEHFTAGASTATATGDSFPDYFVEGINLFHVDPPAGPLLRFIYDTKGPEIVVLSAELDGATATISGLAVDEMGVTSATVNGTEITVAEDGSFTVETPEVDIYQYQTEDSLGHTRTSLYAALGLEYDPSLTVKITQQGLDFAMIQIVNALNGLDLNSLAAGSMLYDSTWQGLFGETYGADGFIRNIELSAQEFNMDLADGGAAAFDGIITNVHAVITLRMHNGFLPPTEITIGAQIGPIDVAGDLDIGVIDQVPDVEISNFSFSVGAVVLDDVGPVFNAIISGLTTGILNLLNGVVSNAVENLLNDAIPEMLNGIIKASYVIRISDGVEDRDMAMSIGVSAITTSESNLYAAMSGGVIPATPDLDVPQPLTGTLYTPDPLPEAELGEGDFAVSISTNVINQTLASAHSVGLTQMMMRGDQIQFGLPRLDDFGDQPANMRIIVDSQAPMTIDVSDVEGSAATNLSIYGIQIVGQSIKEGQTEFTDDIGIRANAKVRVSLSVGEDGTIDVAFPNPPQVDLTGVKIGDSEWVGDSTLNALANEFLDTGLGAVIEELSRPIDSIEIPSFACMSFVVDGMTAVGGDSSHLNIAGTLVKISDACDNEPVDPPRVAYGRGVGTPLSCASDEEYDAGLCYTPCNEGYNGVGPVCWKEDASYGRGVGTIPNRCASGEELDAGLCYPVCNEGYNGVGPVCWSERPLSYGRGVGTIPSNIWTGECPAGKENDAGLCYYYCDSGYNGVGPVCWLENASYGRGVGTIPKNCAPGEENDAGLCYPECSDGYHGVGPVCWTNQALSYTRGVGVPIHTCIDGKEQNGLLCYNICDEGYNGVGPVCWPED